VSTVVPVTTVDASKTGAQQLQTAKNIVTAVQRKDLRATTPFGAGKIAT
jgi:hypothetical protein